MKALHIDVLTKVCRSKVFFLRARDGRPVRDFSAFYLFLRFFARGTEKFRSFSVIFDHVSEVMKMLIFSDTSSRCVVFSVFRADLLASVFFLGGFQQILLISRICPETS